MHKQPTILDALAMLDPEVDDHWTNDGQPLVDAVSAILARPVQRKEIAASAPTFNRETAATYFAFDAMAPAPAPTPPTRPPGPHTKPPVASGAPQAPSFEPQPEPEQAPEEEPGWGSKEEPVEGDGDRAEPEESIDLEAALKMPASTILGSPKLAQQVLEQIGKKVTSLGKLREEAFAEMTRLGKISEALTRVIERTKVHDPNEAMRDIRAYLERQHQAREARAARARTFIEAGTSAKDVAAAIQGRAPIDAAMARRTGIGRGGRPAHPLRT